MSLSNANQSESLIDQSSEYDAKEDPCNDCMSPDMVIVIDIAEAQSIELLSIASSCDVDWYENGPCETKSNEAEDNDELEDSEK